MAFGGLGLAAEITQRLNRMRSPFRSAENFQIEETIDPSDTRKLLCEFANITAPLRATPPLEFAYRPWQRNSRRAAVADAPSAAVC